ncbi:hypothetical protein ACIQ9Q_25245 [Streptomyces sp. NPDC094438]|uniref:hypothetical protein n=1 Tax=Streptomyces sp. NPDC094438 TaxID=3366061 RepID=UPI003825A2EB
MEQWEKSAWWIVPHDLQPDVLRVELIDLCDAFRAHQQRTEPDLALLATLHEGEAHGFALRTDVTHDGSLSAQQVDSDGAHPPFR